MNPWRFGGHIMFPFSKWVYWLQVNQPWIFQVFFPLPGLVASLECITLPMAAAFSDVARRPNGRTATGGGGLEGWKVGVERLVTLLGFGPVVGVLLLLSSFREGNIWVVATQMLFLILTPESCKKMIQFDEHIFQLGWNHQLGSFCVLETICKRFFYTSNLHKKKSNDKLLTLNPSTTQIIDHFETPRNICHFCGKRKLFSFFFK